MGRIFGCEGVNLVDGGNDIELLTPGADCKSSLLHTHAVFETEGAAYLEIGEAIDLGLAETETCANCFSCWSMPTMCFSFCRNQRSIIVN